MTKPYVASAALIILLGSMAGAQATARVQVAPESKLWIEGTSSLHDWNCKATTLDAAIDVDAGAQLAEAPPKLLKKVEVKVPVKAIKCGHGGMDNNLYKALNGDGTPEIGYILASFEALPGDGKDGYTLRTVGKLNIAGKANNVTMDVRAERLPDGTLKATGTVPIKMTDYGITPPTALFGRIKTGDDVKVKFELTLGPRAMAAVFEKE